MKHFIDPDSPTCHFFGEESAVKDLRSPPTDAFMWASERGQ